MEYNIYGLQHHQVTHIPLGVEDLVPRDTFGNTVSASIFIRALRDQANMAFAKQTVGAFMVIRVQRFGTKSVCSLVVITWYMSVIVLYHS